MPSTLRNKALAIVALFALIVGCQPQHKAQPPLPQAAEVRHAHAIVYQIDSDNSWIKLQVFRDGPLARFGHNHVIAIEQISGALYREKSLPQSEVELSLPVAAMAVDRIADRAEAGADFASAVTPEAIAGTRANMFGPKVLAQQQFPVITLRSVAISGTWPELQIVAAVKLRDFDSQLVLPVHVEEQNDTLIAEGETQLSQVQLGLTPYSVLGGGLRVGDTIKARFHLVARRVSKK